MLFKEIVKIYLNLNKNIWKSSTYIKNSQIALNTLNSFLDLDIKNIDALKIENFINNIKLSNKSKKHYLSVLNSIFKISIKLKLIKLNPIKEIPSIRYKSPKIKPFNAKEVKEILDLALNYNYKFYIFLKISLFTGMRTGEILALKLKDIDLNNKTINIHSTRSRFGESKPKTLYSIREIPILDDLYLDLKNYISKFNNNIYLLQTQYNKPYHNTHNFLKFWREILKKLNLEYRTMYHTRHTYATNMLYKNLITPLKLAKFLGHSNTKMIYDVYVNYLAEDLRNFNRSIKVY